MTIEEKILVEQIWELEEGIWYPAGWEHIDFIGTLDEDEWDIEVIDHDEEGNAILGIATKYTDVLS